MKDFRSIEVDLDVHKCIERERSSFTETPNDVLRRLLNLEEIKGLDESYHRELVKTYPEERSWAGNGIVLPHGSKLRMSYNGRSYEGHIKDGQWHVEGKLFSSPSAAASQTATTRSGRHTSLNGLNYWEVLLPGTDRWVPIKDLLKK